MDIKKWLTMASNQAEGLKLTEIRETDKFLFVLYSENGEAMPGVPYIAVNKKTGAVGVLTIPPIENLKILQSAKIINLDDYK